MRAPRPSRRALPGILLAGSWLPLFRYITNPGCDKADNSFLWNILPYLPAA